MAAVTTSIEAETEAAATMEATTVSSSMHNLQLSESIPCEIVKWFTQADGIII